MTQPNALRALLERVYFDGWRTAARWAERDDLVSDEGSRAYERDRDPCIESALSEHGGGGEAAPFAYVLVEGNPGSCAELMFPRDARKGERGAKAAWRELGEGLHPLYLHPPVATEPVAKLVNRIDSDGGKTTTFIRPTALGMDLPLGEYPLYTTPPTPSAPVWLGVVDELLTNIKRSCVRGRNAADLTPENSSFIATFDHIEDLAQQAQRALSRSAPVGVEGLRQFADAIERLAFKMPAPNEWTPQFVSLAIEARRLASSAPQGEWPKQFRCDEAAQNIDACKKVTPPPVAGQVYHGDVPNFDIPVQPEARTVIAQEKV